MERAASGAGDLEIAIGRHEQDAPLAGMARQVLQQVETGAVRPVQIVQQQGEGRLVGQRAQEAGHLPEEPLLGGAVVDLRGLWALAG